MSRRGPDAGVLLGRALVSAAAAAGCEVEVAAAQACDWQSATFAGARHAITLSAARSPRLDDWLRAIADAEFSLRGHLVADIIVDSVRAKGSGCEVVVAALTVTDAAAGF